MDIDPHALIRVGFRRLTDSDHEMQTFLQDGSQQVIFLSPAAISALLGELLACAHGLSDHPDLEPGTWSGPKSALHATRVVFQPGRDATEIALVVWLGTIELVFLLPAEQVQQAVQSALVLTPPRTSH